MRPTATNRAIPRRLNAFLAAHGEDKWGYYGQAFPPSRIKFWGSVRQWKQEQFRPINRQPRIHSMPKCQAVWFNKYGKCVWFKYGKGHT